MKHFLILINYIVPLEKIEEVLPMHREFLKSQYEKGICLFSGPRVPRTGGIIAARAESIDKAKEIFSQDPYLLNNVAEHEYIEFNPVNKQEFLEAWINGEK